VNSPQDHNPFAGAQPTQVRERSSNRSRTLGISSIVVFLVLAGLMIVPAPYVIKSPGPTHDTLGSANAQDLITVNDSQTYEATGQLRLTTVGVSGGPGYPVNFGQVLRGWFAKDSAVQPREAVYPENVTQEQIEQMNQAEMATSQEQATYSALKLLGYDVKTRLNVSMTLEGSPFEGQLEEGDVLSTLNGSTITSYEDLISLLDTIPAGSDVTLGYIEADQVDSETPEIHEISAASAANEDGTGSRLGIALNLDFDFPVSVDITIDRIGGPSAGMMFALGMIERLTEGDQTNGQIIAGTGTMDTSGDVGSIGGIQQKLYGAVRDGATHFLAPIDNCDEVIGHVPDGLRVVAVATLDEAWDAVQKIGVGDDEDLPTCTAGATRQ
jgi:PDZ domain-containing protein